MTTNARKTDAQRLGNGKKAFNVKQVEEMLENAGGSDYTAGTGIVISDDTISVDEQTVAMKSELPDMNDYQPKLTAGTGIIIDADNVISSTGGTLGDFTLLDSSDWSSCIGYDSQNYMIEAKKDIVISLYYNGQTYNHYFPKGKYRYWLSFAIVDNNMQIAYAKIDSSVINSQNINGNYLDISISENAQTGVISITKTTSTLSISKTSSGSPNVKLYYRE